MVTFAKLRSAPEVSTRQLGESACVVSAGQWLSVLTSEDFAETARESYFAGARELLLDLTAVRAVDGPGTTALVELIEELAMLGCELAVATTHPNLVTWLEAVAVEADVTLHATVAEGLTDLMRRPL